jgi:hypothetical protein
MRIGASLFAALAVALSGCERPSSRLHFVVPDSSPAILRIRSHRPNGVFLKPTNGILELHFSSEGFCDVQGELPTFRWHSISASYSTRGPIPWVQFPAQNSSDFIGLRSLGLKDNVEDWYVVGTIDDVREAMNKKSESKVPK